MRKELSKGRKVAVVILSVIFVFCMVLVFSIALTDNNKDKSTMTTQVENESSGEKAEKDNVLYSDEKFKITFVDFKDPELGVTSYNLMLKIENNSDEAIIVSPSDGYANGESVFLGSGLPVKVNPNKKTTGAFIVGYGNTSIKSIDEVKTLELKLTLYDENYSTTLLKTDTLVIDLE